MTDIDLTQFCEGEKSVRLFTRQPFSKGDYSYSTNGSIAVRVPRIDAINELDTTLDIERVFNPADDGFIPVPDVGVPPTPPPCEMCGGSMIINCNHCGSETECDHCDNGSSEIYPKIPVGAALFNHKYLYQLSLLPNCVIHVRECPEGSYFKFDGGDGMIMPMRA